MASFELIFDTSRHSISAVAREIDVLVETTETGANDVQLWFVSRSLVVASRFYAKGLAVVCRHRLVPAQQ